jgi:hypothetical protein
VRLTTAVVLATVALGVSPASSSAGTYDVWSCRLPDGKPAPIAGWKPVSLAAAPPYDGCATRGALRAEFQVGTARASSTTGWQFDAPPGTTIAGYELYRSARVGVGGDGTSRAYGLYHDEPRSEPNVFMFEYCVYISSVCTTKGDPDAVDPMDPDNRVERANLRAARLILRMECSAQGQGRDCAAADPPGGLTIGRARVALADDIPPALDPPTGTLVTPRAVLDGAQAVTVSASDVGGGVEHFAVVVDNVTVANETLQGKQPACRAPFVDLVPCPATVAHAFAFDTTAVPNGRHSLQIAVLDAAGNRTLSAPVPVHIVNGAAPNGVGASRSAKLVARFHARRERAGRRRAIVGYGRTRMIRGRLTGPSGQPIARARVDVMATPARPGARTRRESVVETGAKGRFRYVPRRGPSRRLQFRYRAFTLDPRPSATASAALNVRAGVRLDVTPRRTTSGGTIRFDGRLLGGPGRDRVQVALYAVGRTGRARVPVAVLKTDDAGRFRYRYRFVRTFAPYTYRFEARLEHQRDYPYAAASSRRVTVQVVR